jgi:transcriptional regulator with XRE-family HTH domain
MQFNKELFGNRLKEARNKRKLSQEELSKLTGISVQTLSSYETGHSAPVMDYMYLISLALNTSVDFLLFGEKHNIQLIHEENIDDTKSFLNVILKLIDTNLVSLEIINSPFLPKAINLKITDMDIYNRISDIKKIVDDRNKFDSSTYNLIINSLINNNNRKLN